VNGDATYDVAIVGYGPTGVTAANLLGGRGLRVAVIERDPAVFSRARAVSTDEEVMRIWQQTGLVEELKRDMLWDRPIDFVDARGESFMSFAPVTRGAGHPTQLFLYQPALEATLRGGVERFPNVDVRLSSECVGLQQQPDGVVLSVRDVSSHEESLLHASYVIAADGGSSTVRRLLGVPFEGRTHEARWLVFDTQVLRPWPTVDRLRFHANPSRPAVDCPMPLGHHRWEFPVLPGEDESELLRPERVWQLLGELGISTADVALLRTTVYSHHVRVAARWRVDRVLLVGDAAHVMPPYIGQGMAAGIRDAGNLCWKLAAVIDGSLPVELLDSYETERRPHVRAITRHTVFFGRVISVRHRPVAAVRNRVFRLGMRLPFVGAFVREAKWFPQAHYRSGFLSMTRHRARGFQPPQPRVLDDEGDQMPFDDAVGRQWAVVVRDDEPVDASAWTDAGIRVLRLVPAGQAAAPGVIVDVDGVLLRWLSTKDAAAIALRPDGFVYAAASAGGALPDPPFLS
jgi:3-(3-hydroxy-phenyl)propionate hydroxylase